MLDEPDSEMGKPGAKTCSFHSIPGGWMKPRARRHALVTSSATTSRETVECRF